MERPVRSRNPGLGHAAARSYSWIHPGDLAGLACATRGIAAYSTTIPQALSGAATDSVGRRGTKRRAGPPHRGGLNPGEAPTLGRSDQVVVIHLARGVLDGGRQPHRRVGRAGQRPEVDDQVGPSLGAGTVQVDEYVGDHVLDRLLRWVVPAGLGDHGLVPLGRAARREDRCVLGEQRPQVFNGTLSRTTPKRWTRSAISLRSSSCWRVASIVVVIAVPPVRVHRWPFQHWPCQRYSWFLEL